MAMDFCRFLNLAVAKFEGGTHSTCHSRYASVGLQNKNYKFACLVGFSESNLTIT